MKSSSNDYSKDGSKYMSNRFWLNPNSWFWERGSYTEKAKRYYRKWVSDIRDREESKGKVDLIIHNNSVR